MKHGKLLWSEDECTHGLPGHETIQDAYARWSGMQFDAKTAIEREDRGDCIYYQMPTGFVVCMSYDGWYIYEGEPK